MRIRTVAYGLPRSPLRYPGGKAKAASLIKQFRPLDVAEYREPFVGGGSMFFEVGYVAPSAWLNDRHEGLIAFYEALRDRPEEFIANCLAIEPERFDDPMTDVGPKGGKPKNARLRAVFDNLKHDEQADPALRYFFINRTVYGSGRVNYGISSRLAFASADGWSAVTADGLRRAAIALQGVRITCGDFAPVFAEPGSDVWIFADPPYVRDTELPPTSQQYEHSFTAQDHRRLAEVVRACPHRVMLSYDDHPLVRDLYPRSEFWIDELEWKYVGTTDPQKRLGRELLILNYKPPFSFDLN